MNGVAAVHNMKRCAEQKLTPEWQNCLSDVAESEKAEEDEEKASEKDSDADDEQSEDEDVGEDGQKKVGFSHLFFLIPLLCT